MERMPKGRLEYLKRLLPYLQNQSEDCLYLNIYVPIQGKCECECEWEAKPLSSAKYAMHAIILFFSAPKTKKNDAHARGILNVPLPMCIA